MPNTRWGPSPQASPKRGPLQPPALGRLPSQKSGGASTAAFKPSSCTERIERLGLNPVPRVCAPSEAPKKQSRKVYSDQRELLSSLRDAARARSAALEAVKGESGARGDALSRLGGRLRAAVLGGEGAPVRAWWRPAKAAEALREQQREVRDAAQDADAGQQRAVGERGETEC